MSKDKTESMTWGTFGEIFVRQYFKHVLGFKDIKKTSEYIDMTKHIDHVFTSEKLQRKVGIDVKAPTVVDGFEENEVNYATFLNNRGEPGWLYGESDFAVILTFDEIVIVELSELRQFLEKQTKNQVPVNGNPKKLYTKFHCSNQGSYRKSVSTLFRVEDVKGLPSAKVKKLKREWGNFLRKKYNEINKNMKSI